MVIACKKDNVAISQSDDRTVNSRSENGFVLTNDLLKFDNVFSYYKIKNMFESQSSDSVSVTNAYSNLGFTPAIIDDDYTHVPDNPVLDEFEINLGFMSARRQEQLDEFTFLSNGGEPIDFDDHFLSSTFSKAFLNTDNAFQIGSRIFKFTSNEKMMVIANSDYAVLNTINSLAIEDIEDGYNLRVFNLGDNDDEAFFNFDDQGLISSFKTVLDADFSFSINQDTTISLTNTSFADDGASNLSVTYTWSFDDGSPNYVGITPPIHSFVNDSVVVTLTVTDGIGNTNSHSEELFPVVCLELFFIPVVCGEMTISFNTSDMCPSDWLHCFDETSCPLTITIRFGDGTPNQVITSPQIITHTYSTPGTYLVHVDAITDGSASCYNNHCWFEANVTVPGKDIPDPNEEKCVFDNNSDESHEQQLGSRTWKLKVKIWTEPTRFNTDVGSRTKGYRKWANRWFNKKMDRMWASLEGIYYKDPSSSDPCACTPVVVPYSEEGENSSLRIERNIDDDGKSKKRHLWSTHRGKNSGATITYQGKLFLE